MIAYAEVTRLDEIATTTATIESEINQESA
jgi:hypothetical protein